MALLIHSGTVVAEFGTLTTAGYPIISTATPNGVYWSGPQLADCPTCGGPPKNRRGDLCWWCGHSVIEGCNGGR